VAISLRNDESPDDLRLQQAFWVQATRELSWCWKPTISHGFYSKSPQFDASKSMVGYSSFTGRGDFVSLGYPWVLPGYEGELRERLYEKVYIFAASPE
jgi:hypothetical protein